MIFYTRTVEAASLPVSVDEVKSQCNIDFADDDSLIAIHIAAATGAVEEMTGKALIEQTWVRKSADAVGAVRLDKPPLISVTSISYQDGDDATQSLSVSDFYVYQDEDCAWIEPKPNTDWPQFYDRADAISITFTAGYGVLPPELKQAVLMLSCHYYEARMTASDAQHYEVPYGVQNLVGLRRKGWVGA